ncbi:hypothetical protein, partial [Pseudoalteromonas sp. MMG022]|uniref:hypothetical protein n=1 Tax=Pseudoalteromonas sp. MMG022 TaxID=2909978 RepID=UPI001F469425
MNTDYGVGETSKHTLADVDIAPYASDTVAAKFDLNIDLSMNDDGVGIHWTYDVSLFSAQAIERLNDHLCRLLSALSDVNEQEVAPHRLPILSEAEQHHLVHGLNNTKMDYPK